MCVLLFSRGIFSTESVRTIVLLCVRVYPFTSTPPGLRKINPIVSANLKFIECAYCTCVADSYISLPHKTCKSKGWSDTSLLHILLLLTHVAQFPGFDFQKISHFSPTIPWVQISLRLNRETYIQEMAKMQSKAVHLYQHKRGGRKTCITAREVWDARDLERESNVRSKECLSYENNYREVMHLFN